MSHIVRLILSARMTTDSNGNKVAEQGHYPFGEDWYETGTTTTRHFTSYERDSESTNDYAIHRIYIDRLGRFSSPDPVRGCGKAPQQLDRFMYAANDSVNRVDPTGLY
jgi:RHS repeat-associated protein